MKWLCRIQVLSLFVIAYGDVALSIYTEDLVVKDNPCIPKSYGHSSFVCVCNASYCDTYSPPSVPLEGEFLVYSSDMTAKRFDKVQGKFKEKGKEIGSGMGQVLAKFQLNSSLTFQTVIGWGGAFTDAAAANILSLSPKAQDNLLRSYFGKESIEYNLGRINMGGCDFSWRKYSYADTKGDVNLTTFSLQQEDLEYKIPVIQRSMELSNQPLKLFASPWTAPPWMKTNDDYVGFGQLKKDMYQPWAEYFVKFLDGYAANNISMWGLTAQNEPLDGYIPDFSFNCMGWTAHQQRDWIAQNLGPTLKANGYDDILIMIMDDQRILLPEWAQTVLSDSKAAEYVDGIAVHWYIDKYINPQRLTRTHELFPNYFILGSEACSFDGGDSNTTVILGSWERLEKYAHDIIVDMNHWVTGWTDWNLALDLEGGPNWESNFVDSPIIVNKTSDEFYKNPMYYAMGHFSKFVKEGAKRIEIFSSNSQGLYTTAFTNADGTRVIIILNRSDSEVDAEITVPDRGIMNLTVGSRSLSTAIFA